jgi:hypothetical protein
MLNTTFHDDLLRGMASAFHGCNWADRVEEHPNGTNLSGMEITEIMTPPTLLAQHTAGYLLGWIEAFNGINTLLYFKENIGNLDFNDYQIYEFGWYLAMEAMGCGVSWSDSHDPHGLKVPYIEFYEELPESDLI